MTKYLVPVAFLATTLLISACERGEESSQEQAAPPVSEQTPPAGESTGAAIEQEQTTPAEAKLIAEIEALQTKVDELQQQAATKNAETKASLIEDLNALQNEKEKLKQKVDDLSETGTEMAANLLNGLNQSLTILTRSVEMDTSEESSVTDTTTPPDTQNP